MSQGDIGRHVKALEAGNAGEAAAAAKALWTLALDNAGQTAPQAVGELLHARALLSHELAVYGRQGFDENVKIGTLGD